VRGIVVPKLQPDDAPVVQDGRAHWPGRVTVLEQPGVQGVRLFGFVVGADQVGEGEPGPGHDLIDVRLPAGLLQHGQLGQDRLECGVVAAPQERHHVRGHPGARGGGLVPVAGVKQAGQVWVLVVVGGGPSGERP
jgi:hypothetical protein